MNKLVLIALLIVGVLLIGFGLNSADSISSEFSEFFTGSPTNEAIWMLIGGIILLVIGAGGLLRSRRAVA